MNCYEIESPRGVKIYYKGVGIEKGPLPAFFYFAFSGKESLTLAPINHPALILEKSPLRIFSLTLPYHEESNDKRGALNNWFSDIYEKKPLIEDFVEKVLDCIGFLDSEGVLLHDAMAIGGLSRGGFIATHIAAKEKRFSSLLSFAPLTYLQDIKEYKKYSHDPKFSSTLDHLNLLFLTKDLLHLKNIRVYIGNRDTRVNTDSCYRWVRHLVDAAFQNVTRHLKVELFLSPSIGQEGHGTSPSIFEEGAHWIQKNLLHLQGE